MNYAWPVLVVCLGFSCTREPGDQEMLTAAEKGTALLRQFVSEYEAAATPADCTRLLQQYTDRWKAEVTPLQQAGLAKKGNVSELVVNQKFAERYEKEGRLFRNAFLNAHDLGKRRAEFCKADSNYRKVQETAWRTFLGLRDKN